MKKICFRCKKEIEENSEYFSFSEYSNKKLIKTDYAHKICWNSFLQKLQDLSQAKNLIGGLTKSLTKFGLLPEEEYLI